MNDIISDMLARIRNALLAEKEHTEVLHSNFALKVLDVLVKEGYLNSYSVVEVRPKIKLIKVELKYQNKLPVIKEIKRISKPSRRVYFAVNDLPLVYNGLGISIVSTSKGVFSDTEAREQNVGGEVVCTVF